MGTKQKRRLARAQAESVRLIAVTRQRNQFRQQLSETTHELVKANSKIIDLSREADDLRVQLRDAGRTPPPPIVVNAADFIKAICEIPRTGLDTPQQIMVMPPVIETAIAQGSTTPRGPFSPVPPDVVLRIERVRVRVPSVDPMRDVLGWRLPAGIVLFDFDDERIRR